MMSFEVFKEVVKENIKDYLPEEFQDFTVDVGVVQKVNREKVFMSVRNPNIKETVTPTIYIDDMYERYQAGVELGKLLADEARSYVKAYKNPFVTPDSLDFDNIKDNIIMVLVNTEQNKEMLQNTPHREFHDLSVMYRWIVDKTENGLMSTIVDENIMKQLEMTENDLFEVAVKNTRELFPTVITPISEIISNMMVKNGLPKETVETFIGEISKDETMWVLSNDIGMNGAANMLYEENLHKVAERLNEDLYVLPSSTHEVMLVPTSMGDPEELAEMVQEANMEVVCLEERLSNNVYHYDKDLRKLTMATDSPTKRLDGIVSEIPLVYESEKKR
jgi:hypothetical protein